MFANGFALFLIAWLVLPGIWLATRPLALSPKLWFYVLLFNVFLFVSIGLLCKIFPFLVDPRYVL